MASDLWNWTVKKRKKTNQSKILARLKCSLLAFPPTSASINHSSDQCSPPLTRSTHWPGAKPVSGQGPDPLTLARAPGPMGWGCQRCDPNSQGYLLLLHNAIGHSHQNDGAQGIVHADHSNGCRPLQPTLASAPPEWRKKMALLILCHRCLFVFFCFTSILSFWCCNLGPFQVARVKKVLF